jgi:hypothetical protein
MQINLEFDSNALGAPASFRNAIQTAANLIDAAFTDAITVNISVGYGELTAPGQAPDVLDSGSAEAEPLAAGRYGYGYSRGLLASSVEAPAQSGVQALPMTTTLQGRSFVQIWSAEQKALGLISPTATALDGAVGFATDISPDLLVGVALHELTHAMGRTAGVSTAIPDVFDLYRYTGVGTHLFGDALPSAAAYFSLNGGAADLADYGRTSDNSDFLNPFSGSNRTPNDPFNEYYSSTTLPTLTAVDVLQMQALGFHTQGPAFTATADLFWQDNGGDAALWELNGTVPAIGIALPSIAGWRIQDSGDFNGDGLKADLVLRNITTGMVDIWTDVGGHMAGADVVPVSLDWNVMGAADFNGDGRSDILWRNEQNGYVSVWLMDGNQVQATWNPGQVGLEWRIVGAGDYTGDGKAEILWRNAGTGEVDLWTLDPSSGLASGVEVATVGSQWRVVGQGDFNGDGKTDILWRDSGSGQVVVWDMDGAHVQASAPIAQLGPQWQVAGILDLNGDGKDDIVWRDTGVNQVVVWTMTSLAVADAGAVGTVDPAWHPVNHHFDWI